MADFVVYQGGDDWSALYRDGELVIAGDHYLIDERIRQFLGVQTIESDEFLRGGNSREDVAPDLIAIDDWKFKSDVEAAEAALEAAKNSASAATEDVEAAERRLAEAQSMKSMQDRYGTW